MRQPIFGGKHHSWLSLHDIACLFMSELLLLDTGWLSLQPRYPEEAKKCQNHWITWPFPVSITLGWNYCLDLGHGLTYPPYSKDSLGWRVWGEGSGWRVGLDGWWSMDIRTQESALRTVLNGSESLSSEGLLDDSLFHSRLHMPSTWSQDSGWKNKETKRQERQMLRELGVLGGGWGAFCSNLARNEREKLNWRERTKLDVECARLFGKEEPVTVAAGLGNVKWLLDAFWEQVSFWDLVMGQLDNFMQYTVYSRPKTQDVFQSKLMVLKWEEECRNRH